MPVRAILQLGHPLLLQNSAPLSDYTGFETQSLINDLRDTLAHFRQNHGYGRGIAAVQIGVLQRAIYINIPTSFCGTILNPHITHFSEEQMTIWDDCFSFPDLMVQVKRAIRITVVYRDERGQPNTLEAEGDLSELLQHEIDHLDGILAIHRAVSPSAFATREEWQRRYREM